MGGVSLTSSTHCSPIIPPHKNKNDLAMMEEGKTSPQESSIQHTVATPTISPKVIAELLGTFVIVFIGCASTVIYGNYHPFSTVGIGVAWGLAVMVMIYTFGHVSGGHFNPAITIAFAVSCKFPWRELPAFVAAQLAGSTLAVLTLAAMFHGPNNISPTATHYDKPVNALEAFVWEFIISFILMLTVCGVATDSRAINELSGVAVGSTVLVNVLIAWTKTGASMNPARSIGAALVVDHKFRGLWVYIMAPILGTVTATMIYGLLRQPSNENPG